MIDGGPDEIPTFNPDTWEEKYLPVIINTPPDEITFTDQDELNHSNLVDAELANPIVELVTKDGDSVELDLHKLSNWHTLIRLACEIKKGSYIDRKLRSVFMDQIHDDNDIINSQARNQLRSQLTRNLDAYQKPTGLSGIRKKFSNNKLPNLDFRATDIDDINFPDPDKKN